MVIKATHEVPAERLRAELRALGMDARGVSRADLINMCNQAGIYELNTDIPARASAYVRTNDFPNHESVLIGYGASIENEFDEKLVICNSAKKPPLISGDFKKNYVTINDCLVLKESVVNSETGGNEGDIRREGSQLYMYRSTGVHPGWYPLQFGPVVIV